MTYAYNYEILTFPQLKSVPILLYMHFNIKKGESMRISTMTTQVKPGHVIQSLAKRKAL